MPEWLLEDEHAFAWRVVSLLGMYTGLSFNIHARDIAEGPGITYFSLCFTGADYSQHPEEQQPDDWEERLSCGHIFVGPQYTVDLLRSGEVAMVSVENLKHIVVAESLCDFLMLLKLWLAEMLPKAEDLHKAAISRMKTGTGGPSHSAYLVEEGLRFTALPDFILGRLPPSLQAKRAAEAAKVPVCANEYHGSSILFGDIMVPTIK